MTTKAIDARLVRLEARRSAQALPAYISVATIHDLTDEQLTAIARGRLTVFVGVSPDDWEKPDPLTDGELQAIINGAT